MDIVQKTRNDYNKIAHHFAATRYDDWPELEQFKPFLQDGQRVLDWGCGHGRLLQLFKGTAIHYFGVDQSDSLLEIGRQKYASEVASGRATFISTAAGEHAFLENFFDLAFMIASFFHLPDEESRLHLLKKTFRELKPGGYLFMTVWNLGSDWAKEKIKKDWQQIGEQDFLIPWKNPAGEVEAERYYHHFTKKELTDLLIRAEFAVEKMDYYSSTAWSDSKGGRNLVVVATKPTVISNGASITQLSS